MKYFDFHTHLILKQLFSASPNIDAVINKGDISNVPKLCSDLGNIVQSQIHQSQLSEIDEEVIIGVALYAVEKYLAQETLQLKGYLKKKHQNKLSIELLNGIIENDIKPFSDFTFKRTLDLYLNAPQTFNILTAASFGEALPKNKVNIFFVIEGCHTLVDEPNEYMPPGKRFDPRDILDNLDKLLARIPIIAINPTHMTQSNLCNHAFAIQLTGLQHFIPKGNGLGNDGRTVIQGIFDRKICVDIKHMSYKSRYELIQEIESNKFKNIQPVVCTHTGFTGISFSKWAGFIARKKPKANAVYVELAKSMHTYNLPRKQGAPAFNSTTINLFDEEIVWIVRHGGCIGLSLDRRILGYVGENDVDPTGENPHAELIVDKDYLSMEEWSALNIPDSKIGTLIKPDDCVTMSELRESTQPPMSKVNEYYFDHILLHLKHYFQVCLNAGIEIAFAQKRIMIGSDYDGFINPFLNIATVKDIDDLKWYINNNFRYFLEDLSDSKQWSAQLNIPGFVEDLFYNNGLNFIKSRLTGTDAALPA